MNSAWTVRIERLPTRLRVGLDDDEREPQPVSVTLGLRGSACACPTRLNECIDYMPLVRWISVDWPRTPHVPLLETRVNQLLAAAFDLDARVQEVHVALAKQRLGGAAVSVGIERCASRHEFDAQRRHLQAAQEVHAAAEERCDERQPV